MNPLKKLLGQVADQLSEAVSWALVGGLAISSRVEPRFTRDLDLAIAVAKDAEAEDLVYRFRGADYRLLALIEQEATDRLATVRLAAPGESGIIVDLLFASSGIEPEIVRDAEMLEIASGLVVPVAQVWHLLAMKVLAHVVSSVIPSRGEPRTEKSQVIQRPRHAGAFAGDRPRQDGRSSDRGRCPRFSSIPSPIRPNESARESSARRDSERRNSGQMPQAPLCSRSRWAAIQRAMFSASSAE